MLTKDHCRLMGLLILYFQVVTPINHTQQVYLKLWCIGIIKLGKS